MDKEYKTIEKIRDAYPEVIGSSIHEISNEYDTQAANSTHHSDYFAVRQKCDTCDQSFVSKKQQINHNNHFKLKHNFKIIQKREFKPHLYMRILCKFLGCCKIFTNLQNYEQHIEEKKKNHKKSVLDKPGYLPVFTYFETKDDKNRDICSLCRRICASKQQRLRHEALCPGIELFMCDYGCKDFSSAQYSDVLDHLIENHRKYKDFQLLKAVKHFEVVDKKVKNFSTRIKKMTMDILEQNRRRHILSTWTKVSTTYSNVSTYFTPTLIKQIRKLVTCERRINGGIQISLNLFVIAIKDGDEKLETFKFIKSQNYKIFFDNQITNDILKAKNDIELEVQNLSNNGSGWILDHVRRLDITITIIPGIRGGSPGKISVLNLLPCLETRGLLNLQLSDPNDEKCLLYCTAYFLFHKEIRTKHKSEVAYNRAIMKSNTYKPYLKYINIKECSWPAGMDTIRQLEFNNGHLKYNVFSMSDNGRTIHPLYTSGKKIKNDNRDFYTNINVMLVRYIDRDTKELICHYFPIKNLDVFYSKRYYTTSTKQNSPATEKLQICPYCHKRFKALSKDNLSICYREHVDSCTDTNETERKMPYYPLFKFKNYKNIHRTRFIAFLDFETTNTPVPLLCISCYHFYTEALSLAKKKHIVNNCQEQKHIPCPANGCPICEKTYFTIQKNFSIKCKDLHSTKQKTKLSLCDNICYKNFIKQVNKISHIETCAENCQDCGGSKKCGHISTNHIVRLDPIMYCLIIYDQLYEKVKNVIKYAGIDCVSHLLDYLDQNTENFETKMIGKYHEIPEITKEAHAQEHAAATRCYTCQCYFKEGCMKFGKVFDHDHHTG